MRKCLVFLVSAVLAAVAFAANPVAPQPSLPVADSFDLPIGPGLDSALYYLDRQMASHDDPAHPGQTVTHAYPQERMPAFDRAQFWDIFQPGVLRWVMSAGIDYMPQVGKNNGVGEGEYHAGEDYRLACYDGDTLNWRLSLDQPVYAVADGMVVTAFKGGSCWLNVLVVKHQPPDGKPIYAVYEHLGSIAEGIKVNTVVRKGEVLGKDGNPSCAGAHLHFELRTSVHPKPAELVAGDGYLPEPNIPGKGWYEIPHDYIFKRSNGTLALAGETFATKSDGKTVQAKLDLCETANRPVRYAQLEVLLSDNAAPAVADAALRLVKMWPDWRIAAGKSASLTVDLPAADPAGKARWLVLRARAYAERGDWFVIAVVPWK
jgi:murein DD-endopeptidase MepM/ murein hydrolase activator NlpD